MSAKAITLRKCNAGPRPFRILACAFVFLLSAQSSDRDAQAIRQAESTFVKTSQATRDQRLAWWRDAKFGCFIHWSVYSGPGGGWPGPPSTAYARHPTRIN